MSRTLSTGNSSTNKSTSLVVILGPTAIGKTGLALEMAEQLNGEIIGADSRQVYRYMDIGTAKPSIADRARVPHHLIDIIDPTDNLTLARFQRMAYTAIDDVATRGKLPLLVGGTGQYISAVTEGWSIPEVPPNDKLRAELETFAEQYGAIALHTRLVLLDAESAAKIHHNNVRRVIRALEVYYETGKPISELQRKKPPPYHILELGLDLERQTLYDRADTRVDAMLSAGFVDEVRSLLDRGYNRSLPSMSGLGYLQLAAYLLDGTPLDQAIHDTKIATHSFIRRQMTWFRGHDNGILWHNVEQVSRSHIIDQTAHWLAQKTET